MAIAFKAALYNFAEFFGECIVIKQVVYTETGARCFARIRWANSLLGGPDAVTTLD